MKFTGVNVEYEWPEADFLLHSDGHKSPNAAEYSAKSNGMKETTANLRRIRVAGSKQKVG